MFKEARFGKMFATRDGRKAVYLWPNKSNKFQHSLMVEDSYKTAQHYSDDGKWYGLPQESPLDIVAEYAEIIDWISQHKSLEYIER